MVAPLRKKNQDPNPALFTPEELKDKNKFLKKQELYDKKFFNSQLSEFEREVAKREKFQKKRKDISAKRIHGNEDQKHRLPMQPKSNYQSVVKDQENKVKLEWKKAFNSIWHSILSQDQYKYMDPKLVLINSQNKARDLLVKVKQIDLKEITCHIIYDEAMKLYCRGRQEKHTAVENYKKEKIKQDQAKSYKK